LRKTGDVLSETGDRARACLVGAADAVEQRRLAGAVRADQDPALPGRDVEADIGDGPQAAEVLADPDQRQSGCGHRPAPLLCRPRDRRRTIPITPPGAQTTTAMNTRPITAR